MRSSSPTWQLWLGIALLLAAFAMVGIVLITGSWPVIAADGLLSFVASASWHPTKGSYGVLAMMASTAAVALGALILAIPFAVASALFCHFYASERLADGVRNLLVILAGTPSVVFGLWGLSTIVPAIASLQPPGASMLAGILVLAIMIMPTIAIVVEVGLRGLGEQLYAGGLAISLPRGRVISRIVIPAIRGSIMAGAVLGLARAVGETMAVLMVTGNVVQLPDSLFASVRTLPANIALELPYAMDLHRSALFASGLVMMSMVSLLFLLYAWLQPGRRW
ncbi:MAG: PstC family ABC transporter permease [Geminicoccaceae bacterium]